MSQSANENSIGARIDALLSPFLEDEARLLSQLEGLKNRMQELQDEAKQAENDLAVIRRAKIEAVRDAAKSDPILRAVFLETNATADVAHSNNTADGETHDDDALELTEEHEVNGVDRHPLLSPVE